MLCIKCKQEIPEGSVYCNLCGKKQTTTKKPRTHKRAHKTGSITISKKNTKNKFVARGPALGHGQNRKYIGSFPDRASAQAAVDDYIKKGLPDLYNATVKEVFDMWSGTRFKNLSDSAARNYTSSFKHSEPIENTRFADIHTAHFQLVVDAVLDAGHPKAAKHCAILANELCKYAIKNDIVYKNCAEDIELPEQEEKEKKIFTDEQIDILWDNSDNENVQYILALIYTGFRIDEFLTLKTSNLNLDTGMMKGGIKTAAGKNRDIPIVPNIPTILEYLKKWADNAGEDGKLFDISYPKFLRNVFYKTLFELGIEQGHFEKGNHPVFDNKDHITPHSTRHTFITLCVRAGIRPEYLQRIIGHKNYSTTVEVYFHRNEEELRAEMAKLQR